MYSDPRIDRNGFPSFYGDLLFYLFGFSMADPWWDTNLLILGPRPPATATASRHSESLRGNCRKSVWQRTDEIATSEPHFFNHMHCPSDVSGEQGLTVDY